MLSPSSSAVVAATAEAVSAHAVDITSRFYADMFTAHPELLRIFNKGNQANGEQQRALASAVVAYAVQLIDPEAPSFQPVLERIVHKHVSLGILPEHYPIVGRYLLGAVAEVLGDAVTPAVSQAWDEVYWLFASEMIAQEARLYTANGIDAKQPWERYSVLKRLDEATDVVSFVLLPLHGSAAPSSLPGQYVSVAVDLPDGSRQARQYTLSAGSREDTLQITVRRVRGVSSSPDGVVSNHLHTAVAVGDELDVSRPSGNVVVDQSHEQLLLISAGIGITPIAAILDSVARRSPDRPVVVVHADRSPAHHALFETVQASAATLTSFGSHTFYESLEGSGGDPTARAGLVNLGEVDVDADTHVFLCGPLPFMRAVRRTLIERGALPGHISYEVFGPDLWNAA